MQLASNDKTIRELKFPVCREKGDREGGESCFERRGRKGGWERRWRGKEKEEALCIKCHLKKKKKKVGRGSIQQNNHRVEVNMEQMKQWNSHPTVCFYSRWLTWNFFSLASLLTCRFSLRRYYSFLYLSHALPFLCAIDGSLPLGLTANSNTNRRCPFVARFLSDNCRPVHQLARN